MVDKKLDDKPAIPVGFPDNVNPSDENVKAFEDQQKKDRETMEKAAKDDKPLGVKEEERIGEGIREIPTTEREPEASPAGKSQTKTVSK